MKELEQLALDYQTGDTEALDEIISRCSYVVRHVSRKYFLIGGETEDLYQEGFMGLIKAAKTFKAGGGSSFKNYAFLCVESAVKTAVKKYSSNKNKVLNDGLPLSFAEGEAMPNPEELYIEGENLEELIGGINSKLSPFEGQVLDMYLKGLSYMEMEQATGRDFKAIDNALQRIKGKLKLLL